MTNSIPNTAEDDILKEYDFSKGVRGKYVDRFKEGSNIVVLSPDVADQFRVGLPHACPYTDKILEESLGAENEEVIGKWNSSRRVRVFDSL